MEALFKTILKRCLRIFKHLSSSSVFERIHGFWVGNSGISPIFFPCHFGVTGIVGKHLHIFAPIRTEDYFVCLFQSWRPWVGPVYIKMTGRAVKELEWSPAYRSGLIRWSSVPRVEELKLTITIWWVTQVAWKKKRKWVVTTGNVPQI